MQRQIIDQGLGDQYSMDFYPLGVAGSKYVKDKFKDYDVIICCPHLKMVVKGMLDSDEEYDIPIYLLPPKIYGNMHLEDIIMDCEDVKEMYDNGASNPITFPNEENLLKIKRNCAYRKLNK